MGGTTIFDDPRAAWGAAPSTWTTSQKAANTVPISDRIGISWHYDGGSPIGLAAKPHTACLSFVKGIQTYHQKTEGWADIGYNLLVCPHGRVIEGRGVQYKGAHSPGVNWVHWGVQTLTGGAEKLTAAQITRAQQLDADLRTMKGAALREWGHRDDTQASTECPGDYIEGLVKQGLFAQTPTTQPAALPEEFPMDATTRAYYWNQTVSRGGVNVPIIQEIADAKTLGIQNAASLTALTAAVNTLASSQGLDPAVVQQTIKDAVTASLASLKIVPES